MIREAGYYWVIAGSDEPEVARWDAESEGWVLVGGYDGDANDEVHVISERLPTPTYWRILRR